MNKFESMPLSINEISKLTNLNLWNCQRLRGLPELPSSLKHLDVSHRISLESVASIFTQVENGSEAAIENFNFVRCFSLEKNVLNIKIMDEVGFRIQRLATSLFNQVSLLSLSLCGCSYVIYRVLYCLIATFLVHGYDGL